MNKSEFRVRMKGRVSIVQVQGPLDEEAAAHLLEVAAAAATACGSVQIDLDDVESITPEATALLLFRGAPWRGQDEKVALRTSARRGRQAVLRAYARRRARTRTA